MSLASSQIRLKLPLMPKNNTISVKPWYRKVISVPIFENTFFFHSPFLLPPSPLQLFHNVSFGRKVAQGADCIMENTDPKIGIRVTAKGVLLRSWHNKSLMQPLKILVSRSYQYTLSWSEDHILKGDWKARKSAEKRPENLFEVWRKCPMVRVLMSSIYLFIYHKQDLVVT